MIRISSLLPIAVLTALGTSAVSFAQAPAAPPATPPKAAAPAANANKPRTAEDAVTPAIKDRHRHDAFLYRIKQGEVGLLFLGDSITDGWPRNGEWSWLKFAPYKPADFGIGGDRTEHLLWRITNGELEGINPKVTVLMIGTNNIGHFADETPEWAAAGVKKILDTVHAKLPNTKVLLLGVFPRATPGSPHRQAVEEINKLIAPFADGEKTRYLDISKSFLDAEGNIPADVMPDKLHPNAKGYDIWYEAMSPVLAEMLK
jgi:beta-glucosidase